MLIAFGGAYVNFKLISLPMSAMVGGGDYVTEHLRASEVAALVIILFETLMGLFLMENLRFTNLFPLGSVTEKMRRRLMWVSLTILLVLAGVEVALAVMRDLIISADVALKQTLGGGGAAAADGSGLGNEDPDGRADDPRLHAALRAGVRGDPARVLHQLRPHRAGSAALVLVLRGLAFALATERPDRQGSRQARRRVLRRDHLCAARHRALGCGRTRERGEQPPERRREPLSGKFATADNEEAL